MTQGYRSDQTSDPQVPQFGIGDSTQSIAALDWPVNGVTYSSRTRLDTRQVDTTKDEVEYEPIEEIRPLKWPAQIRDLGNEQYQLHEALMILIEEYPRDVFVARYPEIEAFGEAETDTDAILQLKADIIRLYDELLADDPSQLGPLPRSWRRILEKVITKV